MMFHDVFLMIYVSVSACFFSLCLSWKSLPKLLQFPGELLGTGPAHPLAHPLALRGRNGLVCRVASSKPGLEADAGVRMPSASKHLVESPPKISMCPTLVCHCDGISGWLKDDLRMISG